ncbi:MAG: dihydrofolate reductase [Candidatus Eremiobacteraeota bacterium]|nr:dihydrofolate reductase [Candidatus Eremiobacteraeota bacterium]
MASTVTIHMAMSLDGFIAKHDGTTAWFETSDRYEQGVGYGDVEAFLAAIDCYVMGSATYELALRLGWVYGDKPTVVLTSRQLEATRESVSFRGGDLAEVLKSLRSRYGNIWLVGGAQVAGECLRRGLADALRVSVLPVSLGDGVPLLGGREHEQPLHLKEVIGYENGVVGLWYEVVKSWPGTSASE